MKSWPIILGIISIVTACSKGDGIYEISDPNILRSQNIDQSSLHLAFPSIVGNADRSKILVTYREGTNHSSFDGKIIQMESYDKGQTWLNRRVIHAPVSGHDARDPQMLLLPDQTILCRYFERFSQTVSQVASMRSSDWGIRYENPVIHPFLTREHVFAAARGNMVLIDETIYSVSYDAWSTAWLVKSSDYGKSWEFVAGINPENGGKGNRPFTRINEASLGYADGKMYLVGRQKEDGNQQLQVAVSADRGKTWDWRFLPVKGQAPSLTPYKDAFILTFRNVEKAGERYSFEICLFRDGQLITDPVPLFESRSFDMGYGDVLTFPDYFLVCCYSPDNSIRCYKIKYSIFQ